MSFALDYRKKMQANAGEVRCKQEALTQVNTGADTGFVVSPVKNNADTRGNRRRVLAALSLAAMILSVFNSGAMVTYASGLATTPLGLKIADATEDWHALMDENRMTGVVEEIRALVATARYSSWQDFASLISAQPDAPYADRPEHGVTPVLPASDGPAQEEKDPRPEIEVERNGPVMKAEIQSQ